MLTRGALRLAGSGIALPTCPSPAGALTVVGNADVAAVLHARATSDRGRAAADRLVAASGVVTRYWSHWPGGPADPGETDTVDLAEAACRAALINSGLAIADIDVLILALSTSTLPTIASATPLAARLGHQGPSFDLKAGCAGTLYAMQVAAGLLATGARRVLVVGSDTMTRYMDAASLAGFVHVGDGAGALVLEAAPTENFVCVTDGAYETWQTAGVLDPLPPDPRAAYVMRGRPTALAEGVVLAIQTSLEEVLQAAQVTPGEVSAWVPHALGAPILAAVAAAFDPPLPRHDALAAYGNTGSASLPMALHAARPLGGAIALSALGAGMRWGAAVWRDPGGSSTES